MFLHSHSRHTHENNYNTTTLTNLVTIRNYLVHADLEFEVVLKREEYDVIAFGPINLDYPLGISPLEHIVMNIDYEYSGSKDELEELNRWLEKNRR